MTLILSVLLFWLLPCPGEGESGRLAAPNIYSYPALGVPLGGEVFIYCVCTEWIHADFYLEKKGQNVTVSMKSGEGFTIFPITKVTREQRGSYTCYYSNSNQLRSDNSEPLDLLLIDPELPRPNISLSAQRVVPESSNIDIQCHGKAPIHRFYFHRHRDCKKPTSVEPVGDTGTLSISSVSKYESGSYHCSYSSNSDFFTSEESDEMQLWTLDPYLSRPTIFVSPMEVATIGGNVTVHCSTKIPAMIFYFQKPEEPMPHYLKKSHAYKDKLFIQNVGWEQAGRYSCRYGFIDYAYVLSEASDPVELVVADPNLPRPNISLIPSRNVILRGNITIQCQGRGEIKRFYLHKVGEQPESQSVETFRESANFSIGNVKRKHGGRYCCSYRPRSGGFNSSETSEFEELFIIDPNIPKAAIFLSPIQGILLGGNVTVYCESQIWAKSIYFQKPGDQRSHQFKMLSSKMNSFTITNVSLENRGIYKCRHIQESNPFVISEFSDPVELLIIDPDLPRPSISVRPAGTAVMESSVIFHCQFKKQARSVYFYKVGDRKAHQVIDLNGNSAEFFLNSVYQKNGGHYCCSYQPQTEFFNSSKTSDPVTLFVLDPDIPKPTIFLSPIAGVSLGGNVTLHCEIQVCADIFYFHVPGHPKPHQVTAHSVNKATFPISNVNLEQRGEYNCSHTRKSDPFFTSKPSNSVELLITDPSLARPSISLSISEIAALGSNITIQCHSNSLIKRFYLHKPGDSMEPEIKEPNGKMAIFSINKLQNEHAGNYCCSYQAQSEFSVSYKSDSVLLWILDPRTSRPIISPSPIIVASLGRNVTIHCENQTSAEIFYLLKAGDQKPEWMKEISQNNSSFTISNVTLEHTGKYTCRYSQKLDYFFTSKSSVPTQLLITDPELSRPNISLNSSKVSHLGSSVTIQCWVKKGQNGIFYLHNAEDKKKLRFVESQENMAKFIFKNIHREDSGNYSCSYRPRSGFLISLASNSNATLLILDPNLPSPTISISPSGLVALGQEIKIQCKTRNGPMMFYLYDARDPTAKWTMKPDFDIAEFSISNLSSQHQGIYRCIYAYVERPFLFSAPSEPLELQVSGIQETYDYTQANIVRFIIGSLILLVLTYTIFVEYNIGFNVWNLER